MKFNIILLTVLIAVSHLFAGTEPQIKLNKPWTGSLKDGFTIDYKGKNYPRIITRWNVKKESFYLVRLEGSSSEASTLGCRIMFGKRKMVTKLELDKQAVTINIPVYTGDFDTLSLDFFKSPSDPVKVSLKILSVKEMSQKELAADQFAGSGNFETSVPMLTPRNKVNVIPCDRFAAGEKALELPPAVTLTAPYLAVIPGKKYELRFFACSSEQSSITASVQLWSPFGHKGKHFYKPETFKLGEHPTLCRVEVVIPDSAQIPDAADRIASVKLSSAKKGGTIWIDELTFKEIK